MAHLQEVQRSAEGIRRMCAALRGRMECQQQEHQLTDLGQGAAGLSC